MSEWVFILLGLLLFAAYYVFDKVWDAGATKLNRSVIMPKSHAAGQKLVTTEIVAWTPLTPNDLREHLEARVPAVLGQPTGLKGQLYCTAGDDTGVNYLFGNSFGTTFTAEVDIRPSGEGSTAVFRILTWEEMEGIVNCIEEMDRLAESVRSALSSADPAVTINTRPVTAGAQHQASMEEPATGQRAPEPSSLAFSSFPGLEQAHALGPLHYRVMWEALSRPDGVRRITLGAMIDRPRAEVDGVLEELQQEGLVDVSSGGLIRSRKSLA